MSEHQVWLKDIHHRPYIVVEGVLIDSENHKLAAQKIDNNFRMIDCNARGNAYAVDEQNMIILAVDDKNTIAICIFVDFDIKSDEESICGLACIVNKLTRLAKDLNQKLKQYDINIEFKRVFLEDPIRYM